MTALTPDEWLQDGALLYRLTDDRRPSNRDEIRVTMADQSHSPESCTRRAAELLDLIRRIEALEAELAACKRDAEWYRWLRGRWIALKVAGYDGTVAFDMACDESDLYSEHDGKRLDAAIAAAMAAQEKA